MDDPTTAEAPGRAPTQALRREVSNEECLAKRVYCQELAAQAEDLSVKLLYIDLADLWQAIRQDTADVGPHTMAAASTQLAGVGGENLPEKPDLILMDLTLPNIRGEEATRRIKANPATSHIPVIALTARLLPQAAMTSIPNRSSCSDCLGKLWR